MIENTEQFFYAIKITIISIFCLIFLITFCVSFIEEIYYYWCIYTTYKIGFCYLKNKNIWRVKDICYLFTVFETKNHLLYIPNKELYTIFFIEKIIKLEVSV